MSTSDNEPRAGPAKAEVPGALQLSFDPNDAVYWTLTNTDAGAQQAIAGPASGTEVVQNLPAGDYLLAVTNTDPWDDPMTYSLQITQLSAASGGSTADQGDTLDAGQELQDGQYLHSSDGAYTLLMDGDWPWIFRGAPDGSSDSTGAYLIMQTDGNLVLYDASGDVEWDSGTSGDPGAYATLGYDGCLALYNPDTNCWDHGAGSHAIADEPRADQRPPGPASAPAGTTAQRSLGVERDRARRGGEVSGAAARDARVRPG
ncbi:MAG: hypothetical protein ACLP01_29335 [Solirubrobacteraceae bacterium]